MENTTILLKKYFNKFNKAKKIFNSNKTKSYELFKNSLDILTELKLYHKDNLTNHSKILNETEQECNKYMKLTIESSGEQDINLNKNITIHQLYNYLECGNLELIKKIKLGQINFKEYINDDTILHYAIKFGDTTFLKYAFKLGARIDTTNYNGYTLLECACIEQDPNMISFLGLYGSNIEKHIYFRDGIKYKTQNDSIDINILLKIIFTSMYNNNNQPINNNINNKINIIKKYINIDETINFYNLIIQENTFTYNDLFNCLTIYLSSIPEDYALTYLNILYDELKYNLKNKLGCPFNKLELILISLVPFIDYPYNISIDWVISLELKYLIIKIIKLNNNIIDIKKQLINNLWHIYIKQHLLQEDYIGCLIAQWIAKIKV